MNHSRETFEHQLIYIDENIQELTDLYISSTPLQERIKHFFNLYILEIEELLKNYQKKAMPAVLDKVYIGTKVKVWYEEEKEAEDYVICFPEQSDPDLGYISFLSPVGKQLLLKDVGDSLWLKIPTGAILVTIKEVTFEGKLLESKIQPKEA